MQRGTPLAVASMILVGVVVLVWLAKALFTLAFALLGLLVLVAGGAYLYGRISQALRAGARTRRGR